MIWAQLAVFASTDLNGAPLLQTDSAESHVQTAREAILRNDLKSAKDEIKKAQRINKQMPETYFLSATILHKEGNTKAALKSVNEAIKRRPTYPEAHSLKAILHFDEGDNANSRIEADLALSQGDSSAGLYSLAANLVLADFKHQVKLDKSHPDREKNLAFAEETREEYQRAIDFYQKALQNSKTGDLDLADIKARIDGLKFEIEIQAHPDDPNYLKLQMLNYPMPHYTEEARQNKLSGTVVLGILFTADGHIASITVLRGLKHGLTQQAIIAARQIRFVPPSKNGIPRDIYQLISVSFALV